MDFFKSIVKWLRALFARIKQALRRRNIGIDLGAHHVRVCMEDKGIIIDEPCVVAIDRVADRIIAVGKEAAAMVGKTPANTVVVRPASEGSLTRYEVTLKLLQYYIRQSVKSLLRPPNIMICIPDATTEQDEAAIVDAARQAGAGKVYLMESILASAWGTGRNIAAPVGRMIVDIGGGCASVAVVSMGGVVCSKTIRIGGDALDASIVSYVRDRYGIIIGDRAGETIKIRIGALYLHRMVRSVEVNGRSAETGLPEKVILTSKEMIEAMARPAAAIIDAICMVIEQTPEALLSDIMNDGMMLCGGCSQIYGFGHLIAKITGIPVRQVKNPIQCCARGAQRALQKQKQLNLTPGAIHLESQKQYREENAGKNQRTHRKKGESS